VQKTVQKLSELNEVTQPDLIAAITGGLPAALACELAQKMDVPLEDLAGLLRSNPRTFQRRKETSLPTFSESDRL
jgi:hypothetical protein